MVKLKAPTSWGYRGGAKVDPTVPPSPSSQFDKMFHTLVSNSVSLETKQRVMQRAISSCPSVTLDVQGKGVPSLLDLGSMVALMWEGYFEKNILPLLKTSGELTEAHSLFRLSAANNGVMLVLRYFKADIKLLDFLSSRTQILFLNLNVASTAGGCRL